jgi:hypothetical protein
MAHTSIETPHRKRCPMSAEQRTKLSLAQRAYVTHDPRWAEHRRKLAAAQEARRMTLFDNEVAVIVALRRKGRTFSYIAEEIGVTHPCAGTNGSEGFVESRGSSAENAQTRHSFPSGTMFSVRIS